MYVEFIRLIIILAGTIFVWTLSPEITVFIQSLNSNWVLPGFIIVYWIVGGFCYVIGGLIGRSSVKGINLVDEAVRKVPSLDLLIGIAGLLIGLAIAAIISFPLFPSNTPFDRALTFVIFFFSGAFGVYVTLHKRKDISQIFLPSSGSKAEARGKEGSKPVFREKIVDTSAIIDGRIADISKTDFLEGKLVVPYFVLKELQAVADSKDPLKRGKGRRGLEILNFLQRESKVEVEIIDKDFPALPDVDSKIIQLAKELKGVILTTDFNLHQLAELQGITALNLNDLANALKPVVLPGEELKVTVIREGKEPGQGVGYLDDGTMIVVDGGSRSVGEELSVSVTGILQTSAGRMIFTKPKGKESKG